MYSRNKAFIGLGIVVVVALIGLLAAPRFIDVNRYRPQIEAKLRDKLGREGSLGPMRLSLIPLAFRVDNAVIAEDPKFDSERPFARIETLFVSPKLLSLLHRDLQIKSLQLSRPSVELVRNTQGAWNFSSIIEHRQQAANAGTFSLDRLKIYDGQIGIRDEQQSKARVIYDHIDLVVSDFSPDRRFSADVRAHMPGAGEQVIVLKGTAGPIDHEAIARTPFDGQLILDSVALAALERFINVPELADSDALLSGNADVKDDAGMVSSRGNFQIRNPRIRGTEIGYPIAIDYQISADLNNSTVAIQKANLRLGQTPVSVRGAVNAKPTPAQIDLTVQAANASIAEAARLAAAFGAAFDAKSEVSGILNADVHAQGSVTKPALSGQLAARNLRISGGDLREPVQVDAIELALSPEAIRSNEFTAKTGRTSAAVRFTLSEYAGASPKVAAGFDTANAQLEEVLRIAHAYGVSAVDGMSGTGALTLNLSASGPIKETDQLSFSGSGAIRNASLDVPQVAKPLILRKADLRFIGNGVGLDNLDFSLGQTTGHGTLVANLSAPHVQFSIAANHIDVAEWEQLFQTPQTKGAGANPKDTHAKASAGTETLLNRATGTGAFTADTVVYDDLTLTKVHSGVTLDHGIITLSPLTAGLYNGRQSGSVIVNTRARPVTYTVDSKLEGVDANQLLSSVSPVKQTLYGFLSASADTHFTTSTGAHGILPSLSGKVALNLKDGKIANVDLLHQLATVAQFSRSAQAVEPFTQVVQMTGDFDIDNGVARTKNLKAVIDAGSIAANGTVDLAAQKLNLHLMAVLSQAYSQTVGGTGIGGFLNTALANNNGELVIPVIVSGTFQEPQFAPDLQSVVQMKLENLVPGVNDPAALTKGILGQILRPKPGDDEKQQSNPLQNFLDLFQRGQKPR